MDSSTELPVLEMHASDSLIPHEECDRGRVSRLGNRLLKEGFLKNPPIVTSIPGSDNFVVLDGANRTKAFHELNIPHIVAQLVSYEDPNIKVDTWCHVIAGIESGSFIKGLVKVSGMKLEECSLELARRSLSDGKSIAYIVLEDRIYRVYTSQPGESHDLRILNEIVGAYMNRGEIFRASNDEWEKQAPFYPGITALVVFPQYQPENILSAVRNGYRIPSGVTRHIIPYRALNINIPLEVLQADWSLENKREWLKDWLMERMAANAIRFYAEPTFSFNE